MTSRLLGAMHAVFDREAQPWIALRVGREGALRLKISGGQFTLIHDNGVSEYRLDDFTIASLADRLLADGFEIRWETTEHGSLSASVLLDTDRDQYQQDGDTLNAYGSVLWAHMHAISEAVGGLSDQIQPAIDQLILPVSTGEWAELFGRIFGVSRIADEPDVDYTARIIAEVSRARSIVASIRRNLHAATGIDVQIREPWREIFTLSQSRLSAPHRLQGAPEFQYHTAHLLSSDPIDFAPMDPLVEADRPAGTIFLRPSVRLRPILVDRELLEIGTQIETAFEFTAVARHPRLRAWEDPGAWSGYWAEPVGVGYELTDTPPTTPSSRRFFTSERLPFITADGYQFLTTSRSCSALVTNDGSFLKTGDGTLLCLGE